MQRLRGSAFILQPSSPEEVYTPEELTDEQRMIAEATREFVVNEVEPVRDSLEELNYDLSVQLMRRAGQVGLLAGEMPVAFGGLELDKISNTLITEEMVRAGSFSLTLADHTGIGSLPIVLFGSRQQKQKYLPGLASGELIGSYALTEPGSGSDALGAKTTAVLSADGRHYVLNGTKQFITNAAFADLYIVYAKVDGEKFTAFIIDKGTPGVTVGPEEKKMGIKGSSTCPLFLEDCKVPVENVLGEIGRGHVIAFNILNLGRYKLGAGTVGANKWAIELSAAYANGRKQFGQPISAFPLIQKKLAEMNLSTYANESMVYRTGGLLEQALRGIDLEGDNAGERVGKRIEEYAVECSMNKVFGSESLDFVVDEGVQIHGGYGFIQEYDIEQLYRDSRINRIFEGTNEINRLLISGTLLRKAARGELPLLEEAEKLQRELIGYMPAQSSGWLDAGWTKLEVTRKLLLMVAGLGWQKFGKELEQEQELLSNLAEIAIQLYAMESVYLRTIKAVERDGEALHVNKVEMTSVFMQEAFEKVELWGRHSIAGMAVGDELQTLLGILRKLTRYTPINTTQLKRQIARRVIAAEKYVS